MGAVLESSKVEAVVEGQMQRVDSIIEGYSDRQEQLVSLLQDIQAELNYLPRDVLARVSQRLGIPLSQVFGVATFFRAFSLKPRGRYLITVCLGTACHVRGGAAILQKLERDLDIKAGGTTEDLKFTVETVRCLGACAMGPLVVVDGKYEGQVTPSKLDRVLRRCK